MNSNKNAFNDDNHQEETIKTILYDLHIAEMNDLREAQDPSSISPKQLELAFRLHEMFKKLTTSSISMMLYVLINRLSPRELLTICDVVSKILNHLSYYSLIKDKRQYTNDYWDTYLIKKKKHWYFLNEYLISDSFPSAETRRAIFFDNYMYFNYICFNCPNEECNSPKCCYSHNRAELLYHPLVFKKIKCRLNNCPMKATCPFYHSTNEMEHELNFDIPIIKDMIALFDSKTQESIALKSNALPSEFNPLTYKTMQCPLGNLCKLDPRLCLNYHNNEEKRRKNVYYSPTPCPDVYNAKDNTWRDISSCPQGDKCDRCHNKYEYMYNADIFRTKPCPNENMINGLCEYVLTCPFIHKNDDVTTEGYKIICNRQLVKEYYSEKLAVYKEKQKERKKVLQMLMKRFQCPDCNKGLIGNRELIRVKDEEGGCFKIICEECAKNNYEAEQYDRIKVKSND